MRRPFEFARDLHRLTHVHGRVRHGLIVLVVGLLAVAVAAPLAQADKWGTSAGTNRSGVSLRPDDRGGIRVGPAVSVPAVVSHQHGVRPDDRAGIRALSPSPTSEVRSSAALATGPATVTVRVDDFHWLDAGIGAAIATAALLAGGALLASRRRRTSPRPV
jgi:hypothetical protein